VFPLSETLSETLSIRAETEQLAQEGKNSFRDGLFAEFQSEDRQLDKASDKDIPEFFRAVHP
jgi:hypothetical protein